MQHNVVIAFTRARDYSRYPAGWLRGKAALRLAHAAKAGHLAVVVLDEWERLEVGAAQRAYLLPRLDQALQQTSDVKELW
jgi:hypothetical protein